MYVLDREEMVWRKVGENKEEERRWEGENKEKKRGREGERKEKGKMPHWGHQHLTALLSWCQRCSS